ncbi:MAG: ornithine carbamoyltransferase [Candidatus Micrarchaeota archaeon]
MKNFLSMNDLKKEEIEKIFEMAEKFKNEVFFPKPQCAGLLFDGPSTRTRVSFEVALRQFGMHPIYLDYVFSQLARGEKIEDTGKVLSSYVNIIITRLHKHEMLKRLASSSSVPVINAGTDLEHPCQILGDLYTLKQIGLLKKETQMAYIGDPASNVAHSLIIGTKKFGINIIFIAPKGYRPNPEYEKEYGEDIEIINDFNNYNDYNINTNNTKNKIDGIDVIYVNAFDTHEENLKKFFPYQLNLVRMKKLSAKFFMHPLPAFRGIEINDDLLESKFSLVWKQAENKVAVQKALIIYLLSLPSLPSADTVSVAVGGL